MKPVYLFLLILIISLKNIQTDNEADEFLYNNLDLENKNDNLNKTHEMNETEDINGTILVIKSPKEFDLNIKINGTSKNTLIILFYSVNCIHCIHFQPVYKNISEILKNDTNLKFSKIEYSLFKEKHLADKYTQLNVDYIPMIYIYKNGNFLKYMGNREPDDVISFIYKIHNFECSEIASISELNNFINFKTIFSLDKEKQFILGLFKNSINSKFGKSYIINNYIELNTLNNQILQNNNCYYYFYDEKNEENRGVFENNIYLNNILSNENKDDNENNNYLIYAYNYQRGLNTFPLFNSYLNFQNNSTNINDFNNLNKHIQIIKNKYKLFINNNYLYKYYNIDKDYNLDNFANHNKNYYLFYYKTEQIYKFYLNEINYILSLNNSLIYDYLFILVNITLGTKYTDTERISYYNLQDFFPTEIVKTKDLNKTNIENKLFEHIYKTQNNLIESQSKTTERFMDMAKELWNFFTDNKTDNNTENKAGTDIENDYEQELIDEINKTIIEDEKSKNKENNNIDEKEIKKRIIKRNKLLLNEEEELGFNKNLILLPFYLIIYSILYYFFYKYILSKYEDKIPYIRLPTEDPKTK